MCYLYDVVKYLVAIFALILNIIFLSYTAPYLAFYFNTRDYLKTEAMSIKVTEKVFLKSIECNVTYEFLANDVIFESLSVTPWQKGMISNGRESVCKFIGKDSGIVRYDAVDPKKSFLQDGMPIYPFIQQALLLAFLIYLFRLK